MKDQAGGLGKRLLRVRGRPRRARESAYSWQLVVLTVSVGAFMGQLDSSIVTIAYPSLEREFGAPLATVQWVSLAYLLVTTALMVTVGHMSDLLGRKSVYLRGFALFTLASAACSLAPDLAALVCFRVVQALGAAMISANSVALVTVAAPRERLRGALGFQAAGQALGLAVGPTLGGVLVATVGWRWVFWINVPVGVAAMIMGYYLLPPTDRRATGARFDLPGTAWLASGAAAMLGGVSAFSGLPLPGWAGAVLIVASAVLWWGFVRREGRAAEPLVSTRLMRDRRVAWGLLGALAGYLVLFGPLVLVPLALVRHTGADEMRVGLLLGPLAVGFALAANAQEAVLPKAWPSRRRCMAGALLALVALAGSALAVPRDLWLIVWLGVLGLGLGLFTPSNNEMVMSSVPEEHSGTGGGMINMTRSLGTALGVALVTLTYHLDSDHTWDSVLPLLPVLVLVLGALLMALSAAAGGRAGSPSDPGS
ncbi:MFS transporter [Streptomyces sp. NPDC020379]|uniref:MFS transporter n=1 Tax=Streptomyces sp. NPDC020379 TaxID=3365071 RepID=UPI0037A7B316